MTRKLAISAVMTALSTICLCASILLPTGRVTFLILSSFCILITTAECGTRFGTLSYIDTGLIGFLFMPLKLQLLLYAAFLGYYPIVKSYIEQVENQKIEWLIKIAFFSAVLVIVYFVVQYALMPNIDMGVLASYALSHLPVIVLFAEAAFVIYDILLSMLASYYIRVIQPKMGNR